MPNKHGSPKTLLLPALQAGRHSPSPSVRNTGTGSLTHSPFKGREVDKNPPTLADFKPHLMPIGDYSDVRDIMVEAGADTDGESESESESDEIDHEAAEMAAAQLDVARCLDSDTAGEDD